MKLGVVVPGELIEDVCSYINREFPDIETVSFPYAFIPEIPGLIEGKQNRADAFMFLGKTACLYASKEIRPAVPWATIPRTAASLLRLFVRAARSGFSLHVATDMQNESLFRDAFHETGVAEQEASVLTVPRFPFDDDFMVRDADAMESLCRSGETDFCITIFYRAYELLQRRGIPAYMLQPSYEDIRHTVQKLILAHQLRVSQDSQLVVIAVRTDVTEEESIGRSGYDMALEQLNVTRCLYEFARRIQAACIEIPPNSYLLFATRSLVEQETEHFRSISLLQEVRQYAPFTLSVGFGYGATADEAKTNARRAMDQASLSGGNRAFVIGGQDMIIGPVLGDISRGLQDGTDAMDEKFLRLSRESGVSLRIFSLLYRTCRDRGRSRFTPAELADAAGVSHRTMNRILLKMIDCGYAREVGRRFSRQNGRPSRIIEICLMQ